MKRIEERAKEYASKKADISLSTVYNEALASIYEEAYIAGATEQKEIDEFTSATIKRDAYIRGAKEQKAIDDEMLLKKCDDMTKAEYDREVAFAEWYHKNGKGTPTFSDAIEWARKETIIKVFDRLAAMHVISELSVEGFKKAMEEQL